MCKFKILSGYNIYFRIIALEKSLNDLIPRAKGS